jgi:hypothetical protein
MHIDKYFKDDGYYDGDTYYEDAESFLATAILDFCGCGMPDAALEHVRDALQLIKDLYDTNKYDEWREKELKLFNSDGPAYFMYYFLDNKELTEHGGQVPGWLTLEGEELLDDLNELIKNCEEE